MRFTNTLICLLFCTSVAGQVRFLEEFNENPDRPMAFYGYEGWATFIHSRDVDFQYSLLPSVADHGPNCEPPVRNTIEDTHDTTHLVDTYEHAVYICRNHLMTNIRSDGYGLINLMPDHLVDFTDSEAVIRWDISTLNRAEQGRDWWTVTLMPLGNLNPLHAPDFAPDLEGPALNSLTIETRFPGNGRIFSVDITADHYQTVSLPVASFESLEELLTPTSVTRTPFELRISTNHVRFGIELPEDHASGRQFHWWIDTNVDENGNPLALSWTTAAVLFGHYSYNPRKGGGMENTWHWDNISMEPAIPFHLIQTDRRFANQDHPELAFSRPAPPNAVLVFAGPNYNRQSEATTEVSWDNGQTWSKPTRVMSKLSDLENDWGTSYLPFRMAVPEGAETVTFRGQNSQHQEWMARDVYIVAGRTPMTTSTQVNSIEKQWMISPNPTSGPFTINSITGHTLKGVTIYNIFGQLVAQYSWPNEGLSSNFQHTLGKHAAGTYFIQLTGSNGRQVLKLTKF